MPDAQVRTDATGVLICDDVVYVRALLAEIVGREDGMHVVGEATDGRHSISQAQLLQPDVILLDLSMPRLTGFDAIPEIKRVAPDAKIIVLSGFSSSVIAADVLAHGAHCYLEKGVAPDVIAQAIADVASGAQM